MADFDKMFDDAPTAEEFDSLFDQAGQEETALSKAGNQLTEDVQTANDIALGAAQGATFGFADEAAAGVNRLLDPLISKLSGESATDETLRQQGFDVQNIEPSYEQELQRTRAQFNEAEERSPWLYGGAQIAGSIPSGQALGGLLKIGQAAPGASRMARIGNEALKAAPGVALEALGQSEGTLLGTEEQAQQVGKDVGVGLGAGLVAGGAMQAASDVAGPAINSMLQPVKNKMTELVDESPFLRQIGKSVEYGEMGINPVSEKANLETRLGQQSLATIDTERAQSLMGEILDTDKLLGRDVGRALENASKAGVRVDAYPVLAKSMKSLNVAYDMLEEMQENPRGRYILNKIADSVDKTLDPLEAKSLLDDVDAFISKFTAGRNPTEVENAIVRNLQAFRRNLSGTLKQNIPQYKQAATRFEEFRRFVPESIIAGDMPQEVADVFMGDLKNPQAKLLPRLKSIVKGATQEGGSASPMREAYVNAIRGMRKFEQAEAGRGVKSVLPKSADDYAKQIRDYADDAAVRRQMSNVEEMASIQRNAPAILMNTGSTWRAGALTGANIYGKAKKGTADLAKKIYKAPKEQLLPLADRLDSNGLGTLGKALREAVENDDSFRRNAALFTILQNPSARLLITGQGEDDEIGE